MVQSYIAIDLELNKENGSTTDIIQIGAVAGNPLTGEIYESLSAYVKIANPLDSFIVQLTGITDNKLQTEGTTLLEAYYKLVALSKKYNCHRSFIQWGGGDANELKEQLLLTGLNYDEWLGGYRCIDVKTVAQSILLARGVSAQGGLKKICSKFGISFKGPAHTADKDAENTFILYVELLKRLKNV